MENNKKYCAVLHQRVRGGKLVSILKLTFPTILINCCRQKNPASLTKEYVKETSSLNYKRNKNRFECRCVDSTLLFTGYKVSPENYNKASDSIAVVRMYRVI